jgi:hypothetical protein
MTNRSNLLQPLTLATGAAIAGLTFALATPATAANLAIGPTVVNANGALSSFTVTSNFLATDTISITAVGTVDLAVNNNGYVTNAAGILTQNAPDYGPGATVGNFENPSPSPFNFGSLLLGNGTLGYRQLFAANAANGLGSSAPFTTLSFNNIELSSLFGTGLTTGTVLNFQVSDSNFPDNSGSFTVSGSIDTAGTNVPEPFTIIGTLVGGTAAFRMRKKLQKVAK